MSAPVCAPMDSRSVIPENGIVRQYIDPSANGAPGEGCSKRFDFLRIGHGCASLTLWRSVTRGPSFGRCARLGRSHFGLRNQTVSCVGAGRSGTAGTERRHTSALSAVPAEARRIICARARIYNLTIVIQPQRGYDSYDNSIPFARPAALFCTCHTSSMALFESDESGFAGAAAAVRPARCTTRARSPVLHRRGAVEPAIIRHCSERCTCANGRDAAGTARSLSPAIRRCPELSDKPGQPRFPAVSKIAGAPQGRRCATSICHANRVL